MAKALGSGYPIGATIARTEVADAMQRGDHGTTFGATRSPAPPPWPPWT